MGSSIKYYMLEKILEEETLLEPTKNEDLPLLMGRCWSPETTEKKYVKLLKEFLDSQV